jgi:hypothetical protein
MIRGDISNETPPRIIVVVDVVAISELVETKRLLRGNFLERKISSLDNRALSFLWNKSAKFGLSVELAGFADEQWTPEHLEKLMARLDSRGGNPFNYAELYDDIPNFVSELPYRANLKGVVDSPGRVARYGSWGIELGNL